MSDGAGSRMGVAGALSLSVTSSVAIVICNKYLISTLGFFFATTLTSWHLMVTFFTLYVAQRLRFFEPPSLPPVRGGDERKSRRLFASGPSPRSLLLPRQDQEIRSVEGSPGRRRRTARG